MWKEGYNFILDLTVTTWQFNAVKEKRKVMHYVCYFTCISQLYLRVGKLCFTAEVWLSCKRSAVMWPPSSRAPSEITGTLGWVFPVIEVLALSALWSRGPEWCRLGSVPTMIPDPEWVSLLNGVTAWLMSCCNSMLPTLYRLPSTGLSDWKITSLAKLSRLLLFLAPLWVVWTEPELDGECEDWIRLPSEERDTVSVTKSRRPIFDSQDL